MWQGFYCGGWWAMGFGVLVCAVVFGALVWALLRGSFGSRYRRDRELGSDPMILLKERYARGEIDEEEYQRVKRRLEER